MRAFRRGWLTVAMVVLISSGVVRLITAIYYFVDSSRINDLRRGAFGTHVVFWGVWDIVIAVLGLSAAGLLSRTDDELGRVGACFWSVFVLIESFLVLRFAPSFAFAAILLALLVLYAVTVAPTAEADHRT